VKNTLPVGVAVIVITTATFFRIPLLPAIGSDLGMSVADLGAFTTVFALGRLLTDIPAGRLADRMPVNRMMANAAFLVGSASLLLALAPAPVGAYLAALVLGLGSATTNTTGMTYFSSAAPPDRRGVSVSIFAAGLLVGQAIGPTLGGLIGSAGGWRVAEGSAAAIAWVAAVVLLRVRRRSARPVSQPSASPPGPENVPVLYRGLLYLVPFSIFASLGALTQTLIPVIGDEELGLSPATIGLAIGVGGVFRLAGSVIGGQVADRVSRKTALVPGLLGQAFGVALLAAGTSTTIWLTSIMVMGFCTLGIGVAATMLADFAHGSGVGRRLGPFRFAGDLGLVLAPVMVATLFDWFGTAAAVLPISALLAATGAAIAVLLPETRWLEASDAAQA
jgi:MFS family permease